MSPNSSLTIFLHHTSWQNSDAITFNWDIKTGEKYATNMWYIKILKIL